MEILTLFLCSFFLINCGTNLRLDNGCPVDLSKEWKRDKEGKKDLRLCLQFVLLNDKSKFIGKDLKFVDEYFGKPNFILKEKSKNLMSHVYEPIVTGDQMDYVYVTKVYEGTTFPVNTLHIFIDVYKKTIIDIKVQNMSDFYEFKIGN